MKLGVLDYGAGNLRSVLNAFAAIGAQANLVTKPEDFANIDVLVFPGQGAFGDSVRILKETGLWEPLRTWLKAERPYLGICLGYQLLFESSEECPGVAGLCAVSGKVRKFNPASGLKIPHMGWNVAQWSPNQSAVWAGLPNPTHVYFVHSYYVEPAIRRIALTTTDYGIEFVSAIQKGNLIATQFHPEKSGAVGQQILRNFIGVSAIDGDSRYK